MATFTQFLPKKTQGRIKAERERFEKAFNIPKGTLEKVDKAQSSRGGSSVGSSGGSSSKITAPPTIPPATTSLAPFQGTSDMVRIKELAEQKLKEETLKARTISNRRELDQKAKAFAEFMARQRAAKQTPNPQQVAMIERNNKIINNEIKRITDRIKELQRGIPTLRERSEIDALKTRIKDLQKQLNNPVTTGAITSDGIMIDTPYIPPKAGRGGGGSSNSGNLPKSEQDRITEEVRRNQERARQEEIQKELDRIEALKNKITTGGGKSSSRYSIDKLTGDKLKLTIIENNKTKERIFIRENLTTGVTTTKTFERKTGKGLVQTGSISLSTITATDTLQKKLKKIERFLPQGVRFGRNKAGNIINIDDKNLGLNFNLNNLGNYLPSKFLVSQGLAIKQGVKQLPLVPVQPLFKRLKDAFSRKKMMDYREKQRQPFYDLYGLKGKDRNYVKLTNVARTTKLSATKQRQFNELASKSLEQDIRSDGAEIRSTGALVLTAIVSGPLIGAAIGTVYKSPQTLLKGRTMANLSGLTWKQVGKEAGVEFIKNAAMSYVALKIFSGGTRLIGYLPGYSKKWFAERGLKAIGKKSKTVLKTGLKKGLDVAAAQYLSTIGADVIGLSQAVSQKKYKAATVKASGILGDLVGFYGEKAVKSAIRKVTLTENPRLILTKGIKSKPFAIENRNLTVARLERARKLLKKGEKLKVKFARATPVKEQLGKKLLPPEGKRKTGGVKINLKTPSGYATYAVGDNVYIIPTTFLKVRPGNTPRAYYTRWFKFAKQKGYLPTLKELGIPKLKSPSIYLGEGEYLPRKRGEGLQKYYTRGLKFANKTKKVQVLISPKTIKGSRQPELEIKTVYPLKKGVKAKVTRAYVGKDSFGHKVYVEIVAPKRIIDRIKFKINERLKAKSESLKYLTKREAKIAKLLVPRIIENYNFIYKSKVKGSADRRRHMLKVEQNFRKILKEYKIKASNAEIKAVSRLHDILKLRGINSKDEPIIKRALLEGYLNSIPLVKKLKPKELLRVAKAIGYHQDVNPRTLRALKLDRFTKAFINADRLDIVRYGKKVDTNKLFDLKAKGFLKQKIDIKIPNIFILPSKGIKNEYNRLNKLKSKKELTKKLKERLSILTKKYPTLQNKRLESKIIAESKKKYKSLTTKEKARLRKIEKDYTDSAEYSKKYKTAVKSGTIKVAPYRTKNYKSYKTRILRESYKAGYQDGYKNRNSAPINYKSNYGSGKTAYKRGYKDAYKGKYKINYSTGKYKYVPTGGKITGTPYKYKRPPKKPGYKPPTKTKSTKKVGLRGRKVKRIVRKKPKAYDVYAKPVKRRKLIKVNKVPLRKQAARDLRNYITDTSLSRTAKYVVTKGKPKKTRMRVPKGYAGKTDKKFRRYRLVKGKRKLLPRWKVIEKKTKLLDTKQEREGITLRKRIAQLSKPKKVVKRAKVVKKVARKPKITKKRAKKPSIRPQKRSKKTLLRKRVKTPRKIKKVRKKSTNTRKRRSKK